MENGEGQLKLIFTEGLDLSEECCRRLQFIKDYGGPLFWMSVVTIRLVSAF
jgi:hypothetical protein